LAKELLDKATTSGSTQQLINFQDAIENTALMMAAKKGNANLLRLLLVNGATMGFNFLNQTVFHCLAEVGT
jgi:ankyrin repeat protein